MVLGKAVECGEVADALRGHDGTPVCRDRVAQLSSRREPLEQLLGVTSADPALTRTERDAGRQLQGAQACRSCRLRDRAKLPVGHLFAAADERVIGELVTPFRWDAVGGFESPGEVGED